MEGFFNSKFMIKLQDLGQKLGTNKFLGGLQAAMMSLMAIIMIGALSQIISAAGSESMLGLFKTGDKVYNILNLPYMFTMNLLSVWVVALFGYNYAKKLKMSSPIMKAIDALACFLLIAGTLVVNAKTGVTSIDITYLGAQGMFIGFLVVFTVVQIEKFCEDKNIRIKMPDVVPQFLQDGFSSIIPLLIGVVLFLSIDVSVGLLSGGTYTICSGFMELLRAPLGALTSLPGIFVLCIFGLILWCFGIHGTMIIVPVLIPLMIQAGTANATAHAQGQPLMFYPVVLFTSMVMCGGTGNTLPIALLGLRSKSKQIKAVSKLSVIPGWFGINEPLMFGMPIMYNPVLCIPFVLNVPVVMLCTYLGYQVGFLTPRWIVITALLPMGFGGYLSTLRWQTAIWDYLMLIPSTIIWYPFFKIYEKQLIAKEVEAEKLETVGIKD